MAVVFVDDEWWRSVTLPVYPTLTAPRRAELRRCLKDEVDVLLLAQKLCEERGGRPVISSGAV